MNGQIGQYACMLPGSFLLDNKQITLTPPPVPVTQPKP